MLWRPSRSLRLVLLTLLGVGLVAASLHAQALSNQVLQLLTRVNTWTAANTFRDLRLVRGLPSATTDRLYEDAAGNLYFNGILVVAASGAPGAHNLLSVTHSDSTAATVQRGDLITGQGLTPKWVRLPAGASGSFLQFNGTDVGWGVDATALTGIPAANLTGTLAALSGANLTNLTASNLASGTVPLARLSGITTSQLSGTAGITYPQLVLTGGIVNADLAGGAAIAYSKLALTGSVVNADVNAAAAIAYSKLNLATSIVNADVGAAAAIAWTKISKAGATLADLSTDGSALLTLNATQLTSGTVPLARLSNLTNTQIAAAAGIVYSKLTLTGALVNADLTAGTLLFDRWASNGCTAGQIPSYNGAAWVCTAAGVGSVTSVALTAPGAVITVAGSPITTSGTIALSYATQTANLIWAGPATGAAAAPTFRSMVNADLPVTGVVAGTYAKVTVNTAGVVTAAAAQITLTTDVTGILPLANGGTGVAVAADDTALVGSGAAWVAKALPNCTVALTYTTATNTYGCATTAPAHAILSASHSDAAVITVARGYLMVGDSTPAWDRLAAGTAGTLLRSDGTDPTWSSTVTIAAAGTFGFIGRGTWVANANGQFYFANTANTLKAVLQVGIAPTISSGFGTTPAITAGSTDAHGEINVGTGGIATGGVIAFGQTWPTAPHCMVQDQTTSVMTRVSAISTTTMTMTGASAWTASDKVVWICVGG